MCREASAAIRTKAQVPLSRAFETAYQHFPIDRAQLLRDVVEKVFSPGRACQALQPEVLDDESNLWLDAEDALERGFVVMWLPATALCPAESAWRISQKWYAKDMTCSQLVSSFPRRLVPVIVWGTRASPRQVMKYWKQTRQDDPTRTPCISPDGADEQHVVYRERFPRLEGNLHNIDDPDFLAWWPVRSCRVRTGDAHEDTRSPQDLAFNFGAHTFIGVDVMENGTPTTMTLIVTTAMAGYEDWLLAKVLSPERALAFYVGMLHQKRRDMDAQVKK